MRISHAIDITRDDWTAIRVFNRGRADSVLNSKSVAVQTPKRLNPAHVPCKKYIYIFIKTIYMRILQISKVFVKKILLAWFIVAYKHLKTIFIIINTQNITPNEKSSSHILLICYKFIILIPFQTYRYSKLSVLFSVGFLRWLISY